MEQATQRYAGFSLFIQSCTNSSVLILCNIVQYLQTLAICNVMSDDSTMVLPLLSNVTFWWDVLNYGCVCVCIQYINSLVTFWMTFLCRFDSKRFCRDCRRNVIREFKELKELKRMRKEPRCTSWFCVADTAFKCEVRMPFLIILPICNFMVVFITLSFFGYASCVGKIRHRGKKLYQIWVQGSCNHVFIVW